MSQSLSYPLKGDKGTLAEASVDMPAAAQVTITARFPPKDERTFAPRCAAGYSAATKSRSNPQQAKAYPTRDAPRPPKTPRDAGRGNGFHAARPQRCVNLLAAATTMAARRWLSARGKNNGRKKASLAPFIEPASARSAVQRGEIPQRCAVGLALRIAQAALRMSHNANEPVARAGGERMSVRGATKYVVVCPQIAFREANPDAEKRLRSDKRIARQRS